VTVVKMFIVGYSLF